MSTLLTVGLIVCGFFTAACIWAINLKMFANYGRLVRIGSVIGIVLQLVMFVYSIHFVKGADYSWLLILGLSVASTIVWLLACGLALGTITIIGVGCYWSVTTWKKTNFKEYWLGVKTDIRNEINSLKSWLDDEE